MVQTRVTYDVSTGGKVHSDGTTAMIRHWARDTDAQNGIYRSHSNEAIDASRSINNETYFPTDGPRDEWTTPGSTEEIAQRLQDRLATVTGRTRKDSVLMRGVVLGLSPEWVEEHTPNWKTDPQDRKAFMDALQPVVDIVIRKAGGAKNVVLVSGHFDEEAPQIQMAVTPVTEDGRLRQNDFELFKSPKNLGGLHKKIRKELKESGLDVILESSERSREHLSNLEYARKADQERAKEIEELAKQRKEIAKERKQIAAEREQLERNKEALADLRRIAIYEGYKQGYEDGEVEAGALQAEVEQQAAEVKAERERLDEDKAKLPEMKRYAAQQGREEGRKQGYDEGREEAGTILANARDEANDIVAQAQAQVQRLRDELDEAKQQRDEAKQQRDEAKQQRDDAKQERDDLDKETKEKTTYVKQETTKLQKLSNEIAAKLNEVLELDDDIEALKSSRDEMTQLDSDFMDHAMTFPGVPEEYERFKQGRVKGMASLDTEKREYYERTVGENNERRERFINSSKQQSQRWQQQKQLEEEEKRKKWKD